MSDGGMGGMYDEQHLEPTGQRLEQPRTAARHADRLASSVRVSETGTMTGTESYVIVGEVIFEDDTPDEEPGLEGGETPA